MRRLLPVLALLLTATTLTSFADAQPKKKGKKGAKAPVPTAVAASAPPAAPEPTPAASEATFDRQAAIDAITAVDLGKCRATNTAKGEGHVLITYGPEGQATAASVDKGPWLGTPTAKCLNKIFAKTKVPSFRGDAVTVGKTFRLD